MTFNKDSWQGPTIYTDNSVSVELVDLTKEKCELFEAVHVSFDVTGRTRHVQLAHELERKLGADYIVEVDYDLYKCKVSRR
jgi:hypothetical protein